MKCTWTLVCSKLGLSSGRIWIWNQDEHMPLISLFYKQFYCFFIWISQISLSYRLCNSDLPWKMTRRFQFYEIMHGGKHIKVFSSKAGKWPQSLLKCWCYVKIGYIWKRITEILFCCCFLHKSDYCISKSQKLKIELTMHYVFNK
jgi:hypothetical protein